MFQEGDNQEGGSSEESQPNKEMVTMVSRGEVEMVRGEASVVESEEEVVEDEARQGGSPNIQWDSEEPREGGIVTPETPVPIEALEKKNNMLVNAINNLMEKFLPLETKKFDLQDFSQRLRRVFPIISLEILFSWCDDAFSGTASNGHWKRRGTMIMRYRTQLFYTDV